MENCDFTSGTNVCDNMSYGGWWDDFTLVFYLTATGVLGSFWLMAMLCTRGRNKISSPESSDDESPTPYEDMYIEDLAVEDGEVPEDDHLTEEKLNALAFSHINEETPRGNVVMLYDNKTESFWWFCNTKSVPYKYLETVCRKYVCAYECRPLYKGMREQLESAIAKATEAASEAEAEAKGDSEDGAEVVDSSCNSVFATFKSYNKGPGASRSVPEKEGEPIPETVTRFSYRGKLPDWEELQRARETVFVPPEKDAKDMDFAAFKKMQGEAIHSGDKVVL